MKLLFEYQLLDTLGWARASLTIGDASFVLDHEYTTNPLLVLAGVAVWIGADSGVPVSRAAFENGQVVSIVELKHRDPTQLRLLINEGSQERVAIDADIPSQQFALAVAVALHGLYRKHGVVGYQRQWSRWSFPFREYMLLRMMFDHGPAIGALTNTAASVGNGAELVALRAEPAWLAQRRPSAPGPDDLPEDIGR